MERDNLKIYHYSNKNFNDKIKVEYFGYNAYSFNDTKYSIKRSFFYTEKKIAEYHLKDSKYCYITEIEKTKLYNLKEDKENLKSKFIDITELLNYLKVKYLGIIYNVGFNIVSLFYDIKFSKKIDLTLDKV